MTRIFAMPSTRLGRLSAWLLLTAFVLMVVLASVVPDSALPSVGKLNVGPLIGVLVLLSALVVGVAAMVREHERSWVVWIAVGLPSIVLGAEVLSLLIGGE